MIELEIGITILWDNKKVSYYNIVEALSKIL